MSEDAPFHGWLGPGDLEPGDRLGWLDGSTFTPGAEVVAAVPVPGTELWNVTTHAGSLVLRAEAEVYVFAGTGPPAVPG